MSLTDSRSILEDVPRRRSTMQRHRRAFMQRNLERPGRHLEWLEDRSLLSSVTLSGFPASGFRSTILDGAPPWNVSVLVDGQATIATGYDESTELLGDAPTLPLTTTSPLWIAGIIGDTWLRGSGAATNEVDFYRIDLPDGEHYALSVRALAQQFGSALDPALSLFDSTGQLLASNDDALNVTSLTDSELFAGLNGGTYYIAVSAGGNLSGGPGGFDPLVPGSGSSSRGTKGQYLLQITAAPDNVAPQVVSISLEPDATLTQPLVEITVRFSEAMDLEGLQHGAALLGPEGPISLSATSYKSDTLEVTYRLDDRPITGDYVFTLSAAKVTDRADNAIAGTGVDGDYAINFSIDAPAANWQDIEPNNSPETAQDLGPLYSNELNSIIPITGSVAASGDQDYFRFRVTRLGFFTFHIQPGAGTNQVSLLMLRDGSGRVIGQGFRFPGLGMLLRLLKPGDYLLQVNSAGVRPNDYTLTIHAASDLEIPLMDNSVGPAVSAVLTTHEGQHSSGDEQADRTATSLFVATNSMAYSVVSVPTVVGQPVGGPQPVTASKTQLAWADMSSGGRILPDGFTLRPADDGATRFSVSSVSGSFLEPLPATVFDGTQGDNSVRQIGSELRAAVAAVWNNESSDADPQGAEWNDATSLGKYASDTGERSSDDRSEDDQLETSPSRVAFGMIASLGAVGAATPPNRRRATNWIQHAFEWLGLEI